jgi:hypothetical protein
MIKEPIQLVKLANGFILGNPAFTMSEWLYFKTIEDVTKHLHELELGLEALARNDG